MPNSDFSQNIQEQRQAQQAKTAAEQKHLESIAAVTNAGNAVVSSLNDIASQTHKVEVTNQVKSVKTPDVRAVVDAVNTLIQTVTDAKPDDSALVSAIKGLETSLTALPESIVMADRATAEKVEVTNQLDLSTKFDEVTEAIRGIEVQPNVKVAAPKVTIDAPQVDLSGLTDKFDELLNAIKAVKSPELPEAPEIDLSGVERGLKAVKTAITNQTFPVPNYVLPFTDINGAAKQAQLVASVLDPTKSALVVANADGSSIGGGGGGGGGTQYANNAANATPTGTVALGYDGSNVRALKTDATGQLYIANPGSGGGGTASSVSITDGTTTTQKLAVDANGKIGINNFPATQAISAASLPLPTGAAQDGTDATGVTAPTGAVGIRGWLSGIYSKLSGTLTTSTTIATDSVGLAKDATLTGGTQKAINRGGAKGTTTAADVTSTASGANHQPLDVAIYDGSGNLKDPTQIRALNSSDQVTVANSSLAVTGTFWQATQPVSAAALPLPSGAATETTLGNVAKDATLTGGTAKSIVRSGTKGTSSAADVTSTAVDANTQALHTNVTNFPTTQAVSGTVTANVGTTNGLALDATLTGGTQRSKLTDGTNNAAVKAASTAAVAADPALVVAVSPNNTVPVSGTFWQTTQPVSLATNTPTIQAGTNIIGKVGIDQTTPGTTNGVQINAALPAGTNAIGKLAANSGVVIGDVNAIQSGTWTVQPGNTANTTPWLVAQQTAGTAAITSVSGATSSTTVLASNTSRKGAYFFNDSTAILYLAYASTASTTAYTLQIPAGGFYEMPEKPLYTGLITGIWASATGAVRVTELT